MLSLSFENTTNPFYFNKIEHWLRITIDTFVWNDLTVRKKKKKTLRADCLNEQFVLFSTRLFFPLAHPENVFSTYGSRIHDDALFSLLVTRSRRRFLSRIIVSRLIASVLHLTHAYAIRNLPIDETARGKSHKLPEFPSPLWYILRNRQNTSCDRISLFCFYFSRILSSLRFFYPRPFRMLPHTSRNIARLVLCSFFFYGTSTCHYATVLM